jgi:choline dehydrogenase-like flavoprotein
MKTKTNAYAPTDPGQETWDAIVIGTGMGGATAGYALAEMGWRVLFIEKGPLLHDRASNGTAELAVVPDDRPEARLARGYWPYPLAGRTTFGEQRFFAPLGCGSGGTTTLYAAQLERLRPEDFRPRAQHPAATGSTLPEAWPIEYAELAQYYDRAEKLYRVCGTPDPLGGPADGASLREPPPMSERDRHLFESFEKQGLHPYRAHVGCEFVEGCTGCGAGLCPRECKNDSGRICLMPALRNFGAKLLANCEVIELEADASAIQRVRCRLGDREIRVSARVVILAAGAFMSPVLLLKSRSQHWPDGLANASGQVGRNLMVHAHTYVAVSAKTKLATTGPLKSISLNDFYVDRNVKLGTLQTLGITVSHGTIAYYIRSRLGTLPKALNLLLKPCLRLVAPILALPFRNAAVFAGIIEDLPYSENRVLPDAEAEGGLHFEYRYPEELRVRSQTFADRLREVLGSRHRLLVVSGKNNLDYGHVCGTIRFGNDPKTSVLDRDNCAHDVPNLYVVDASFFPSSGGVNLSLTIAANALRVADAIDKRLGKQPRHGPSAQAPIS